MNINWKVRVKNPSFWIGIVISIVAPVLTYFGLTVQDLTTWSAIGSLFVDAISNPYVILTILVSVYNTIVDPTTTGVTDSANALTYTEPNSDKGE